MKCIKTIDWMRKEKNFQPFGKQYQVAIYEDKIAHSKRYYGSKIALERGALKDTLAANQNAVMTGPNL